jgi:hypothetical protein
MQQLIIACRRYNLICCHLYYNRMLEYNLYYMQFKVLPQHLPADIEET